MTRPSLTLLVVVASLGSGFSVYEGRAFVQGSAALLGCVTVAYIFMRGLLGVAYEFCNWMVGALSE